MAVYVDCYGHMRADSADELHAFAQDLGLKRRWFQGHNPRYPHYDLTTLAKINKAIRMGAQHIPWREMPSTGYTEKGPTR